MEKKFCCERFESYYELSNLQFPSFRILKLYPKFSDDVSKQYAFLIAIRYLEIKVKPLFIAIEYCPFCGTHLNTFYRSDNYVNAEDADFF